MDFDRKNGVQIYAGDCKDLGVRVKMSYQDAELFCKNFLANPEFKDEEQENGFVAMVKKILLNSWH